ncbi:MAG: hypothetical protein GWN81_25925, partial [Phycisphaerae bacterium]|nr:hypothetical protein [Phycisphaerae bacterium]
MRKPFLLGTISALAIVISLTSFNVSKPSIGVDTFAAYAAGNGQGGAGGQGGGQGGAGGQGGGQG